MKRLVVRGLSTISAMGASEQQFCLALNENRPCPASFESTKPRSTESTPVPVFRIRPDDETLASRVRSTRMHSGADRTTLLAVAAARQCRASLEADGLRAQHLSCGVSIGSARGPTELLESSIETWLDGNSTTPETSPMTTAGILSSAVAQDGNWISDDLPSVVLGTSMTCSSAFQSLLVGAAFLRSGMAARWLFGGAEAPITPFTLSQLRALRLYGHHEVFPCRPLAVDASSNAVVLGEGAGVGLLEAADTSIRPGDLIIEGLGWATERTPSATGISAGGVAFEHAMRSALAAGEDAATVDAVVMHAPGSIRGDAAEYEAILRVLGSEPLLCTTKHLTGHTYGASGMLSLELARALLRHTDGSSGARWPGLPYPSRPGAAANSKPIRRVLVNAAGFGGTAVSVLVSR